MHPQRSVITRVLGTDPEVDVDTFSVETRPGDVFMLCSDGLTSMVDDGAILDIVERNRGEPRAGGPRARRGGEPAAAARTTSPSSLFEIGDDGEDGGDDTAERRRRDGRRGRPSPGSTSVPVVDDDDARRPRRSSSRARASRPAPPRGAASRGRRSPPCSAAAIVVVLAALVVWTLSRSYFVGAQPDGHVAVYQGFPWNIVGNVRLYRVRYESPVLAGELSQAERRQLFDHDLRYGAALDAVKRYEGPRSWRLAP